MIGVTWGIGDIATSCGGADIVVERPEELGALLG